MARIVSSLPQRPEITESLNKRNGRYCGQRANDAKFSALGAPRLYSMDSTGAEDLTRQPL